MPPALDEEQRIHCRLDELLEARGMTLTQLSQEVGVSIVNLSVLKNDRARDPLFHAVRDLRCSRL
jgi:putative transcriptional regulator